MRSLALALLLAPLAATLGAQDRLAGRSFATRSEVIAPHAMAATSQPLATQVALDVLRRGGSAVDAAIAANAVLGLVEPHMNGLGGDLFAMVWDARTRSLAGLNASGRSPAGLEAAEFERRNLEQIPIRGPLALSVPGAVDGWFALHERFGRLPMKELLAPAVSYARDGFPVSEIIAAQWQGAAALLADQPGFAEVYTPGGRAPERGEVFRNPALARTLERIGEGGRDVFYRGEIARELDAWMKEIGGFLRHEDLAAHRSEWVDPVSTDYRGHTVWELPPNGQGIAALEMLNILEGYDLAALGFGSADYIHLLTEAKKLAYEDRARYYADPDFAPAPVSLLVSKEYAAERRALIDPKRAASEYPPGDAPPEHGDTIYLAVADADGNMVSFIQSIYWEFGSGVTPPRLGFALQNRGSSFNLEPGHPNSYAPGKRPFHTIIPAFVTKDGDPWLAFGVMGGAVQPQGHVQVLVNMIDFGMNLQEAGDAPRIRHSGSSQPTGERMTGGGVLNVELGFDADVLRELMARGHQLAHASDVFGGYQAVLLDAERGVYFGASDPRKDGQAAGY